MAAEKQRAVMLLTEAVNLLRSPDTTTVATTRSDSTTAPATSSSTTRNQYSLIFRCLPPVSLLQLVGSGSVQSFKTLLKASLWFSMKSEFPIKRF